MTLTAPDGGGTLSMQCVWVEDDREISPERLIKLNRLFYKTRKIRSLKNPELGERSLGWEGEGVLGRKPPWYRRLLRRAVWRRWRAWGVAHRRLSLIAMYLAPPVADPESATIAGMIVGSMELRDHPACPQEVFARNVLDLVQRKFPQQECAIAPDFQVRIGDTRVNLTNFYRTYVNSPQNFEEIILPALTTIFQVQGWGEKQTDPGLETVRSRIMPMLYPEEDWQERLPELVATPWVAGLVVLYVVDESHAYWFIRRELMQKWELGSEELHELAIANMQGYFDKHPMDFSLAGDTEGPRLLMPSRPDAYNASRLLSESFLDRLRGVLATPFAVGIPSRDFLVGVSLHSSDAVNHVRKRVAADYRVMDHPLCRKLLLVTLDGVTELAEDGDTNLGESDVAE